MLLLVAVPSLVAIPLPRLARRMLGVIGIHPRLVSARGVALGHYGSAVGLTY